VGCWQNSIAWSPGSDIAVNCKLSVLGHMSRDTSWDTVECRGPGAMVEHYLIVSCGLSPDVDVLNDLQEKDRSRPEVSLSGQNWENLQLTAKADSPWPRVCHAAADRTARV